MARQFFKGFLNGDVHNLSDEINSFLRENKSLKVVSYQYQKSPNSHYHYALILFEQTDADSNTND